MMWYERHEISLEKILGSKLVEVGVGNTKVQPGGELLKAWHNIRSSVDLSQVLFLGKFGNGEMILDVAERGFLSSPKLYIGSENLLILSNLLN